MSAKRRKGPTPKSGTVRSRSTPKASTAGSGAGAYRRPTAGGSRSARSLPADQVPDVWHGTGRSTWALPAVALLLVGAAAIIPATVIGAFPMVAAAIILLLFGRVQVTCDAEGLRARSWPLPFLSVDLAADRITSVSVDELRPRHWGGWGYRGSLKVGGRAAWLLRRGEGLVLEIDDDRTWAVSVDDADVGAAVLAKHLAG